MKEKAYLLSADIALAEGMETILSPMGWKCEARKRLDSLVKAMKGDEVVVIDQGPEALASLRGLLEYHPEAICILIIPEGCSEEASEAGAFSCIERPSLLRSKLKTATKHCLLRRQVEDSMQPGEALRPVLGKSTAQQEALTLATRAAKKPSDAVLITGERGSGRGLMARHIHNLSPRRRAAFLHADALSSHLEKDLFGPAEGLCVQASSQGGTLYLSNADFAPEETVRQVLQRLGALEVSGANGADIRVICSANGIAKDHPLRGWITRHIPLAPLRQRQEDIIPLAEAFLKDSVAQYALSARRFSTAARRVLEAYDWPGNVSELKNVVLRAALLSEGPSIDKAHLMLGTDGVEFLSINEFLEAKLRRYLPEMLKLESSGLYDAVVNEVEKSLFRLVLMSTKGNQVRASKVLGITRTTLRAKIKHYGITCSEE